jgi:hypothetical protein
LPEKNDGRKNDKTWRVSRKWHAPFPVSFSVNMCWEKGKNAAKMPLFSRESLDKEGWNVYI